MAEPNSLERHRSVVRGIPQFEDLAVQVADDQPRVVRELARTTYAALRNLRTPWARVPGRLSSTIKREQLGPGCRETLGPREAGIRRG